VCLYALATQAARRIANLNLATAWDKWRDLIMEKRDQEAKRNK
jgi:hypothetical protein